MKLASPHFLNGALGALLMCAVAAACGSDSQHKSVRGGGGAGAGGQGGVVQGGTGMKPEAGNAGEAVALGGVGGALARMAWTGFMTAAKELADKGTFTEFANGYPGGELNKMFK